MSFSPERFLRFDDRYIISEPVKGTCPRGRNTQEDKVFIKELRKDEKESAELDMITDLLRNDMAKVSEAGSVKVLNRKKIQILPKVIHSYSKIQSIRKKDISIDQALLSMFPGGSISGCPKHAALKYISELETYRRSAYTGTLGVIFPDGSRDYNIAIRSIIAQGNDFYLGIGGGITLNSDPQKEYEETLHKAAAFL